MNPNRIRNQTHLLSQTRNQSLTLTPILPARTQVQGAIPGAEVEAGEGHDQYHPVLHRILEVGDTMYRSRGGAIIRVRDPGPVLDPIDGRGKKIAFPCR